MEQDEQDVDDTGRDEALDEWRKLLSHAQRQTRALERLLQLHQLVLAVAALGLIVWAIEVLR